MSYTPGVVIPQVNVPGRNSYYQDVPVSPNRLGIYDLAALHYRFGVNPAQNSGNDTYTFRAYDKDALGNGIYIADGGGQDLFDASEQTLDLNIDLTPGSWIHAGDKTATLVFVQDADFPLEDGKADATPTPTGGQMFIGYGTQIESAKGGSGNDILKGNSADNYLFGFDGDDQIHGGAGNDQLEGGRGADTLSGGAGKDSFIFASPFDGAIDTLLDFSTVEGDILQLAANIFTTLQSGALAAQAFVKGTSAQDADDRLLYDQSSGELAYDADGSGSQAAIVFARLNGGVELEHHHIQIV